MKKSDCPMSPKVHPALQKYFAYCFAKAAAQMRESFKSAFKRYKMIGPQFGILRILESTGPLSQMQLCTEMGIDKASMVKFIDGLEKLKFVHRTSDKNDRRLKNIHLTEKGKKALEDLLTVCRQTETEFLSPLTASEQQALRSIIPKLLRKF